LGALAAYDLDVSIVGCGRTIPLCRKGSGYDAAGIDYLIGMSKQYYDRRQRDRTLMKRDRVAVLGQDIAVVERTGDREVYAVLWNKLTLRIARREIRWDQRNMRWEAEVLAPWSAYPPH